MRSGVLAAVVVWAVGCSSPGGLQFELDASADATADELLVYVGGGKGKVASIALQNELPDDVHKGTFFPDVHGDVEVFPLSNGRRSATLSFVPGDNASILTVVAVGLTNGTPTSFAALTTVPLNGNARLIWNVVLKPVTNANGGGTRAVARWGKDPDAHYCVRVTDRSSDKPLFSNVVIGIEGDKDCDGFPELDDNGMKNRAECDDEWQFSKTRPSAATLSCVQEQVVNDNISGGTVDICTVGGPRCEDGLPARRQDCSMATPFCAPMPMCSRCGMDEPEEKFACLLSIDPVQSMQMVPYVRCEIEYVRAGSEPPQLCPVSLRAVPPPGWLGASAVGCTTVPTFHAPDRTASWTSSPSIGGITITFGNVSTPAEPCAISVSTAFTQGAMFDDTQFPAHGLIALDLPAKGRGLVTPIVFALEPVTQCSTARDCTSLNAAADGTMLKCMNFAPVAQ